MKWEQSRQYSEQEIQAMQQDAIQRVRQMQQRSEQVLRRSPKTPSFFINENDSSSQNVPSPAVSQTSPPHSTQHFGHSAQPIPSNNSNHPSSSFHSSHPQAPELSKPSIEQILSALNLDKERLLILALLFLLYNDGADQTLLLALLYLFL